MYRRIIQILILLICLTFTGLKSYAGIPSAIITIEKALSTMEISSMNNYLDDMVTVSIVKKNKIYSRQQAINVLKSFFSKDKDGVFTLEKHGKSADGMSLFGIGKYVTRQKQYSVYFFMKYDPSIKDFLIREIKID